MANRNTKGPRTRGVDSILALDLAGRIFGWAYLDPEGEVLCGHEILDAPTLLRKLNCLHLWLTQTIEADAPALVAIEQQFVRGGPATVVLGALVRTAQECCEQLGVAHQLVSPTAWKFTLTGHGAASKTIVQAALRRLGYTFDGGDEADALGLLIHTAQRHGLEARPVLGLGAA